MHVIENIQQDLVHRHNCVDLLCSSIIVWHDVEEVTPHSWFNYFETYIDKTYLRNFNEVACTYARTGEFVTQIIE